MIEMLGINFLLIILPIYMLSFSVCIISHIQHYIAGIVHDCSMFIANTLELLQSYTKLSIDIMLNGSVYVS